MERGDLSLQMMFIDTDKKVGPECQIIPGEFVAQHGRRLKCPKPFLGNYVVVLVGIVRRRKKDKIGVDVPLHSNHFFQDGLPVLGEVPHWKIKNPQVKFGDPENFRCLFDFVAECIPRAIGGQRLLCCGKRNIHNVTAFGEEPADCRTATELTVVRVRGQNENSSSRHLFAIAGVCWRDFGASGLAIRCF